MKYLFTLTLFFLLGVGCGQQIPVSNTDAEVPDLYAGNQEDVPPVSAGIDTPPQSDNTMTIHVPYFIQILEILPWNFLETNLQRLSIIFSIWQKQGNMMAQNFTALLQIL
ncbi:MAG: hypothetical protein UV18_C0002G0060 [Candidatus Magasanikbacteria bacterium GW2011_GWC2_42_27]|nr:MAG: hypothetical protein UV18_C0002G0060 [Candidatus Magasanikbacteria bacterium GW2011_GWC2_42_27]